MNRTYVIPTGTTVQISRDGSEQTPMSLKDDIMVRNAEAVGADSLEFQVGQWRLIVPKDAVVPVREEDGRFDAPALAKAR